MEVNFGINFKALWAQVLGLLAGLSFIFHNYLVALETSRLQKVRMLILDVDGILTDGKIWMDSSGHWRRTFCVRDGVGIRRLIESGYQMALITGSKAEDIQTRVKNLGIHYLYEGSIDKMPAYEDLKKKTGMKDEEMAYMGDDHFDVPVLKSVGFAATVPEAMFDVLQSVHYVTRFPGGNGAVREVCDYIFNYGALSGWSR